MKGIFKKLNSFPPYAKILAGMIKGLIIGYVAVSLGAGDFIYNWISPFGEIFIRLLKLIAVPLVLVSLIKGIGGLGDMSKLASIGLRSIVLYTITTVCAITLGVILVSVIRPGDIVSDDISQTLSSSYAGNLDTQVTNMENLQNKAPLQPLIDIFPENLFGTLATNGSMLQVILIAILIGIATIMVGKERNTHFMNFIDDLDAIMIKLIDIVMAAAPYGVAALMANLVVGSAGDTSLLSALGTYTLTVVLGLLLLMYGFYPLMVKFFSNLNPVKFIKALFPVQLVGFTTSSSAATLATTMSAANDDLGLPKSVTSFTLPIGVTINMDGTSCYQAIGVIFIAQVMNIDLSFGQILTIIATTTLSSIGTPGVPGGSIVISMMVLSSVGIPPEGIALIMGVDRPLDMLRTSVNVTGDVAVSAVISKKVGELV
ncbi:MAG: dicarboxylate/amino acid:cation symporter [Rikenellaceae bacterium]